MNKHDTQSMIESSLPKLPSTTNQQLAVEYVSLVYDGMDKVEAYGQIFPDRYASVVSRAKARNANERRDLLHHITKYEAGKFLRELYLAGAENYYAKFVDKRTKMLDEMYDVGMDKSEDMRHRLSASKIFLSSIPEAIQEQKVKHEVKVHLGTSDDFVAQIKAKEQALLGSDMAVSDIIDAEVE